MRTLIIAGVALLLGASPAATQTPRIGGYGNGSVQTYQTQPGRTAIQSQSRQQRWGGQVNGRWYGGSRAPGGWNAYRRPTRGWTLPRYWIAPTFYISDYSSYGLSVPPRGYSWTRYYDDAVLMDGRGQVWDSVSGLDWDGYGYAQGGYAQGGQGGRGGDAGYGYAYGGAGGTAGGGYVQQGYPSAPPPPYGAPYGQPQYNQCCAPQVAYGQSNDVVQQGGYESSRYAESGYAQGGATSGGYASGGYWYPGATTTTVTIQSAPVIETTTTEYITETTTYAAPRKVYRAKKRVWKPRPKARRSCSCGCGCR